MTSGGSRTRSGPKPDPNSRRSSQRGYSLTVLPVEGYTGSVPDFPLPKLTDRESEVWAEAWRTPQACAWALPSESWRLRAIAMWVRLSVRCEDQEASPSLLAQLHRFAHEIGMTSAGLAEMGWTVVSDELAEKRSQQAPQTRSRPKVVADALAPA